MDRSHRVDISAVLSGGRQMVIADDVPLEPFEGISFPTPAKVALELHAADRMLVVEGAVDASVRAPCSSCLDDVPRNIHIEVNERLDPSHGRDDDPFGESNVLVGGRLDVADLAAQLVVTMLPMGLRCSDDCRGLCPACGVNRNKGECSCDRGH